MTRNELLKKYRELTTRVGKHKASNNVFLDKVISSLVTEANRHQPWDGSDNATAELLRDAAAALVWIESNASKLEAKFGRNETQGYMYGFVSRTSFSIARHYGGCKINGAYYDYIPNGDLLVREDVLKWIRKEMKKASV